MTTVTTKNPATGRASHKVESKELHSFSGNASEFLRAGGQGRDQRYLKEKSAKVFQSSYLKGSASPFYQLSPFL